jgi:hypothetical protein
MQRTFVPEKESCSGSSSYLRGAGFGLLPLVACPGFP